MVSSRPVETRLAEVETRSVEAESQVEVENDQVGSGRGRKFPFVPTPTSRTKQITPKFEAQLIQLHQPNNDQVRWTSVHTLKCYGCPCKLSKSILETPAILELLLSGLFRHFNKIEFSIYRSFQNCFISVKAF